MFCLIKSRLMGDAETAMDDDRKIVTMIVAETGIFNFTGTSNHTNLAHYPIDRLS